MSAHVIRGTSGSELVELFSEQIDEAGGEKFLTLPADLSDIDAFIESALSIETKAIETYSYLDNKSMHSYPVTFLARQ